MQYPSFIRRLIGWQILAMGIIWAILIGCLFLIMTRYENGDLDRRMGYFATILAETAAAVRNDPTQLHERVGAVERLFVEGVIETLENAKNYSATFQVFDHNNRVIYHDGPETDTPWPASDGFGEVVRNGVHFRTIVTDSVDHTISVMVAESDATRWSSVWPMLRIIGVSQILIFAACIGALGLAAKRGIRPIRQMATSVLQRRLGDLEPIDDHIRYEETAPLVAAFNELLARETRRLDAERGFLADAAHELRTPIAALTASAHQVVSANDDIARRAAAIRLDQGAARNLASALAIVDDGANRRRLPRFRSWKQSTPRSCCGGASRHWCLPHAVKGSHCHWMRRIPPRLRPMSSRSIRSSRIWSITPSATHLTEAAWR